MNRVYYVFLIIVAAGIVLGATRLTQNYIITSSANVMTVGTTTSLIIATSASDNVWTYLVPAAIVIFVPVAVFSLFRKRSPQQ